MDQRHYYLVRLAMWLFLSSIWQLGRRFQYSNLECIQSVSKDEGVESSYTR